MTKADESHPGDDLVPLRLAYVGLGSNLGDRLGHLNAALDVIERRVGRLAAVSYAYETDPVGLTDQPRFLNAVCAIETALDPHQLLAALLEIEAGRGRVRGVKNGPRTLDLDLLIYEDLVIDELGLQVPHPRLTKRAFVLVPLAEIAPDFVHSVTGQSVREMLECCLPETSSGDRGVGAQTALNVQRIHRS